MEFTKDDIEQAALVMQGLFETPEVLQCKVQEYITKIRNIIGDRSSPTPEQQSEYRNIVLESFNYFKSQKPYQMIYYIRCVTEDKLCFTYKDVPEFKEIVDNYGKLIRESRISIMISK